MTRETLMRPIEILLVEDNPGDVRLIQEAFKHNKIRNNLHIAANGLDAIAFLNKNGDYQHVPTPDLILLDLSLPKKDGREVLEEIKQDKRFKRIPVVILTTSQTDQDIQRTYDLHANCYISKPIELDEFIHVIRSIENFWMMIVKLP